MKTLYKIILVNLIFLASCGGSGSTPEPAPTPIPSPKASNLIFPENNKECTEGLVQGETQSTITFQWTSSENTDSYEINITNLNSNNTTKTTSNTNEKNITLERGTPYEWFVISKATGTTETSVSPTWRFYNQGLGIENYAPFPAQAINPKRGSTIGATASVTLEWSGEDIDNDIKNYEILFGTSANPTTSLGILTTNSITATVTSGLVYYWIVITTDNKENTSTSEVFEFKVS
tara:strand:- start:15201 stop:15902 length:702 start_codon:yes stop_codon:yes gene_type:complete